MALCQSFDNSGYYLSSNLYAPGDEKLPACDHCLQAKRYCDHRKEIKFRHGPGWKTAQAETLASTEPSTALQDQEIARLFQHYSRNLAPWYDLSDALDTFEKEVPREALNRPLLFNAIIAFAAIHVSKTSAPGSRLLADKFHSHCLKLLIALREDDVELKDGAALAAVCLLRSYEILAEDLDPNRHLGGAYALAASGAFGFDRPSLLRAGFFNYLREDITYSLMHCCALKIDPSKFARPTSIEAVTDDDQLNIATLLVAAAINQAFSADSNSVFNTPTLARIEQWKCSLPGQFEPYSQAHVDACGSVFPNIWMLRDCHTAVLQYHLVALTLTEVMQLPDKKVLDRLNQNAIKICGLAFTAKSAPVIVNSFGPISYCCRFLQGEPLQIELTRRLQGARKDTGWPVQRILDALSEHWKTNGHENI